MFIDQPFDLRLLFGSIDQIKSTCVCLLEGALFRGWSFPLLVGLCIWTGFRIVTFELDLFLVPTVVPVEAVDKVLPLMCCQIDLIRQLSKLPLIQHLIEGVWTSAEQTVVILGLGFMFFPSSISIFFLHGRYVSWLEVIFSSDGLLWK